MGNKLLNFLEMHFEAKNFVSSWCILHKKYQNLIYDYLSGLEWSNLDHFEIVLTP